ncbi:MAG TPA: hypothetical protein VFU15_00295 [Bacteroidia bacterium]|nr:hypothetical protein [Bacteroidia bacterium]
MQKFNAYLLVILFVAGSFLPAVMSVSLFLHRADVFDLMEKTGEQESLLSLSPSEFAAIKWNNDHEFTFHNSHYDLFAVTKKAGNYILSCFSDKKEDEIINTLDKTAAGERGAKKIAFRLMIFDHTDHGFAFRLLFSDFNPGMSITRSWNDAPRAITSPPPRFMS